MATATPRTVTPRQPDVTWLSRYLTPSLIDAAPYKIDTPSVTIKLDQNESPWDLPPAIKARVVERLLAMPWNRYPPAFADQLAEKIAAYAGVSADSVLLGPGSNYLVSLILTVFSKGFLKAPGGPAKLVIARPSFPLYESHCRYEGIPYELWNLDDELEYDVAKLPALAPGSMVVFASPNNPVGNALPKAALARLLDLHPQTLFVADEAYFEYTAEPYTDLLASHANLLLIRTFSKTMGAAGVRVGYVLGSATTLELLKKLRLPYLLNHFSLACADTLLGDPEMRAHLEKIKVNALTAREEVYRELAAVQASKGYRVKRSEANFLLVRWPTNDAALTAYRRLIDHGILVRNVSGGPGLAGCLRITLGNDSENQALVKAFKSL